LDVFVHLKLKKGVYINELAASVKQDSTKKTTTKYKEEKWQKI